MPSKRQSRKCWPNRKSAPLISAARPRPRSWERRSLWSYDRLSRLEIKNLVRDSRLQREFPEMYDFMVFGYYATAIGNAFFPSGNPFLSLMLSLMTFGAGFLMRPLGAIVLGA